MDTSTNLIPSFTQFTFFTTCLALGASAFFFYNEQDRVHFRYRLPMVLACLICGIACLMYYYMISKYVPGQVFPTQLRYFDWLVTTPIMLLEFTALLKFSNRHKVITQLVLWDLVMITAGYIGETAGFQVGGFQMRWVMLVVGVGGWLGVLVYMYTAIKNQANLTDIETRRCVAVLTRFVTFGWLIYPLGYIVRALFPQYGDLCQIIYNVGDVVNKVGFGVVVYAAGIAAAEAASTESAALKTSGNSQLIPTAVQ
jgi:bacteriorhodopsin